MKRRDFPIIRLAPWEHLPSAAPDQIETRAQNVVPFEWGGRQFELAGRFADVGDGARYLFLRDVSSEDEANWVLGKGRYYSAPDRASGGERLGLPGRLSRVSRSRYFPFVRLFHFSPQELGTEKPWRVGIAPHGIGCWIEPYSADFWQSIESFHLPVAAGESLLDWSAREVRRLLLQQVACPDSDTNFALNWAHLTQIERENRTLCVRRGSVVTLRELLTYALKIEPELQQHDALWSWEVGWEERGWSGLHLVIDAAMSEWWSRSPWLCAWKREIFAYFGPHLNAELRHRHACVGQSTGNSEFLLRIETRTPTHHERLEAALFLRDWARDKISSRKLELLLSRV